MESVSNQCRLCLTNGNFIVQIFPKYADLIQEQIHVEISKIAASSQYICETCINCIANISSFKEQCINSELYWTTNAHLKEECMESDPISLISEPDVELNEEFHYDNADAVSQDDVKEEEEDETEEIKETKETKKEKAEPDPKKTIKNKIKKKKTVKKKNEKLPEEPVKEEKEKEKKDLSGICPYCGEFKRQLHMHIRREESKLVGKTCVCNTCGAKFFDKYALTQHENLHTKRLQYPCVQCGKVFLSSSTLKLHLRTHSDERNYTCDICQQTFKYLNGMKRHKKTVHFNIREHTCKVCGAMFSFNALLTIHMRVHTNERPFECHMCHKKFKRKCTLADHIITHTKDTRFSCPHCNEAFVHRNTMKNHISRIHPESVVEAPQ